MFRPRCGQIETEFDGGFQFLGMERNAQNAIDACISKCKLLLGRDREADDGHFARRSHFANLIDGFNNALRAQVEPGRRQQVVRREDHDVKFFATGFMGEFVSANGPGRLDAGAVVAEVQDHDFDQIADTAIRIANQKVERFHQFEKMQPPGGMGGMRAFLPVAKQGLCQRETRETPWERSVFRMKIIQKCL